MSFYEIVRTALRVKRQQGLYATARFLKSAGLRLEDRRKLLTCLAHASTRQAQTAQVVELATATPAQFASLLQEDIARGARIVKASGATVD